MGKDTGNEAKGRECSEEKNDQLSQMISDEFWKKICWIQPKVIFGDIGENAFFKSGESRTTLEGAKSEREEQWRQQI